MWILPIEDLFIGGSGTVEAESLYFTVARKKMLPALQQQQVLSERVQRTAPAYRVLACLNDDQINESLLRIGASLAAAKDGELLVLRILETSELLPSNLQRSQGKQNGTKLTKQ